MSGIEDFMKTFGFTLDALTLFFICALFLLINFAGGLFSNIILSFGGPIRERSLTSRTSFRMAAMAEFFLIVYVVYYHTVLIPVITTAEMIFWGFIFLAGPLMAALGAQLTYVAFAKKIEELKRKGRNLEKEEARAGAGGDDDDDEEEEG
jgi:hypothetical protein